MGSLMFIALYCFGLALLFLELFLPGMIIGVIGVTMVAASMITAWMQFGSTVGMLICLVEILAAIPLVVIVFKILPKTKIGKRMFLKTSLNASNGYTSSRFEYKDLLEHTGITVTDLRPTGSAKIDGRRYDVISNGEFIEKDKNITVIDVEGHRIVVKEI